MNHKKYMPIPAHHLRFAPVPNVSMALLTVRELQLCLQLNPEMFHLAASVRQGWCARLDNVLACLELRRERV